MYLWNESEKEFWENKIKNKMLKEIYEIQASFFNNLISVVE